LTPEEEGIVAVEDPKIAVDLGSCTPLISAEWLGHPLGGRFDHGSRRVPRVFSSAPCQTADCTNRHVVIANDLTTQPDSRQTPRREHIAFGDGHAVGLAVEELDAARGTARVTATGMQLIDSRILLESQNQPLTLRHFELAHSLDRKLRHDRDPSRLTLTQRIIPSASEDGKLAAWRLLDGCRRMLRHANISTTQRYMHLDDWELAEAQDLVE
jgi:hypothetical protein